MSFLDTMKVFDIISEDVPVMIQKYFTDHPESGQNTFQKFTPCDSIYEDDAYSVIRAKVDQWFIDQGVRPATDEDEGEQVIVLVWW
jgi:hypothetical protein